MLETKRYQEFVAEGQIDKVEAAHKLIDEVMINQVKIGEGQNANIIYSSDEQSREYCVKHLKENPDRRHYQSIDWEMKLQDRANQIGVKVPRPVLALITDDEESFMVMETINGKSLREIISNGIELPVVYKDKLFWDKLKSMLFKLHEYGIYHRDLHLGNIMLDFNSGEPVLIDFGWSAHVPGGEDPYREINNNINHQEDFPNDDVCLKDCKRELSRYLTNINS